MVPDLIMIQELEEGTFRDIDLFSLFGQASFIQKFFSEGGEKDGINVETDFFKKELLIGLQDRLAILNYFSKRLQERQQRIIEIEQKKNSNEVYDASPYQVFLACLLGHLNAFKAIDDLCKSIDSHLHKQYWETIKKDADNYYTVIALRNAFQHHETPLITTNDKNTAIVLTFSFLNRIWRWSRVLRLELPWLKQPDRHRFEFVSPGPDPLRKWLNQWAAMHLADIDPQEKLSFIDRKRTANGSLRFVSLTLEEVRKYQRVGA